MTMLSLWYFGSNEWLLKRYFQGSPSEKGGWLVRHPSMKPQPFPLKIGLLYAQVYGLALIFQVSLDMGRNGLFPWCLCGWVWFKISIEISNIF